MNFIKNFFNFEEDRSLDYGVDRFTQMNDEHHRKLFEEFQEASKELLD
jgi:hypothetical protein